MSTKITKWTCVLAGIFLAFSYAAGQEKLEMRSLKASAFGERMAIKPEIRRMDVREHPSRLRKGEMAMRADYKPFPDSTITYNLKGDPIGKAFYEYDANGNEISYKEYKKNEATNDWYESFRRISTYTADGYFLSEEVSEWDENLQMWIGDYRYTYVRNSSGATISYEYDIWDYQRNTWKGSTKNTFDNSITTTYNWDSNINDWVFYERIEYVSDNVRYEQYWDSELNKWGDQLKIESKTILNYNKSGVQIILNKENWVSKDDAGNWDENNPMVFVNYSFYSLTGWNASFYVTYDVSYDNAGNIKSVKLSDMGDNTFTTTFAYNYTVNKANSNKVYINNDLIDNYNCVYDNLGRMTELSRNLNYNGDVEDYKYAYTYIGDSNTSNSVETYLWDSNKKVFVEESKDMYTYNADGSVVMYQTYSWAETKWVLSSYTIYYPNNYTSDLEFEETNPVGSNNQGAFTVGFDLPQDADVTGSFYITFPDGFVLDEENTALSDELSQKYSITITKQEGKNTWFVEIKDAATANAPAYRASSYKKILTVAFTVDEGIEKGDYTAEINNLNFLLSDGTMLIENQRDITLTVDRDETAIKQLAADKVNVFASGELLSISTPDIETVNVYNICGESVHTAQKAAGIYTVSVTGWKKGIYIVTGSKGWARKVLIQ